MGKELCEMYKLVSLDSIKGRRVSWVYDADGVCSTSLPRGRKVSSSITAVNSVPGPKYLENFWLRGPKLEVLVLDRYGDDFSVEGLRESEYPLVVGVSARTGQLYKVGFGVEARQVGVILSRFGELVLDKQFFKQLPELSSCKRPWRSEMPHSAWQMYFEREMNRSEFLGSARVVLQFPEFDVEVSRFGNRVSRGVP